MTNAQDGFLARWSRRKVRAKSGAIDVADTAVSAPSQSAAEPATAPSRAAVVSLADADVRSTATIQPTADFQPPALPTMSDVSLLTHGSDYSRFLGSDVDPGVSNAAMKKLFSDPRYNVMDGLDTYIDDYGKPDPICRADMRLMHQARSLGLFGAKDEDESIGNAAMAGPPGPVPMASGLSPEPIPTTLTPEPSSDDDADLRLQQDDASRRPGADPGSRA